MCNYDTNHHRGLSVGVVEGGEAYLSGSWGPGAAVEPGGPRAVAVPATSAPTSQYSTLPGGPITLASHRPRYPGHCGGKVSDRVLYHRVPASITSERGRGVVLCGVPGTAGYTRILPPARSMSAQP